MMFSDEGSVLTPQHRQKAREKLQHVINAVRALEEHHSAHTHNIHPNSNELWEHIVNTILAKSSDDPRDDAQIASTIRNVRLIERLVECAASLNCSIADLADTPLLDTILQSMNYPDPMVVPHVGKQQTPFDGLFGAFSGELMKPYAGGQPNEHNTPWGAYQFALQEIARTVTGRVRMTRIVNAITQQPNLDDEALVNLLIDSYDQNISRDEALNAEINNAIHAFHEALFLPSLVIPVSMQYLMKTRYETRVFFPSSTLTSPAADYRIEIRLDDPAATTLKPAPFGCGRVIRHASAPTPPPTRHRSPPRKIT